MGFKGAGRMEIHVDKILSREHRTKKAREQGNNKTGEHWKLG